MNICAHRGAYSEFGLPENSIAALNKAVELSDDYQIDYVEFDIRLTSDHKVIIMHDATTGRTCNLNKDVATSAYVGDLDQLTLTNGENIPLFSDFLDIISQPSFKMKAMIETKNVEVVPYALDVLFNNYSDEVAQKLEWITFPDGIGPLVYERYISEGLACPSMALSSSSEPSVAHLDNAQSKHFDTLMGCSMSQSIINTAFSRGMKVTAWTLNTRETILPYLEKGVTTFLTDKPCFASDLLDEIRAGQSK